MEKIDVMEFKKSILPLIQFKPDNMWIDYDEEADVLYISFKRPQQATDTETLDKGVLLRYRNNELVGMTILNASTQF